MWTYDGVRVFVPRTADIARPFFREWSSLVQEALDRFAQDEAASGDAPWRSGEDPIFTLELGGFSDQVKTNVVPVEPDEARWWGVHVGHKATKVQPSPFVERTGNWPLVDCITIELSGRASRPQLVRAYAGEYRPPLPWMESAPYADGGVDAARNYWRSHAYTFARGLVKGEPSRKAPGWYAEL